mgnify:FL=1
MPIYKIDGSETIVRNMTIYVEADTKNEAEEWAGFVNTWEDVDSCIIRYDERVDGDIDETTEVDEVPFKGLPASKVKWDGGVAVT